MREVVLAMLGAGYITQSEAATLAGVTRQRIGQWVKRERIHPIAARARHLRELIRNAHPDP
jgi:DNA-binding XRE family transcriptional regulator